MLSRLRSQAPRNEVGCLPQLETAAQCTTDRRKPWMAGALILMAAALFFGTLTTRGEAAFPGTPGKISFDSTRDGNTEIYTMNADGSDPTRLTDNPAIDRDAAFSPDGRRIAFVSERDGNSEIYIMNADGSNQTRLTNNTADDFQPAFSPDGKQIAFMSNRGPQGDMEIFLMYADGTHETQLTPNNTSFDGQPTFSPDGSTIAFVSNRGPDGTPSPNYDIYTMKVDNPSAVARLTNSDASESRPNYSPDGSRIVFRTDRTGNGDIYVMNADGSGETQLTVDPALDGEPAFSPDGKQIAFRSHRVNDKADIYVMNADGSAQTNLTIGQTDPDGEPAGQFADRRPDWQPIVPPTIVNAAPNGTTILAGSLAGGDATSLAAADGAYYRVSSTTSSTATSDWYGSFTGVPSTLSALRVTYQGYNSRSCSQTIYIYNWSSGSWSALNSRKVGTAEARIADVPVGGTQSNYVGGGEVRVRVRCTVRGGFVANANQLQIRYEK
jgi:Tol biopolymer transport system component